MLAALLDGGGIGQHVVGGESLSIRVGQESFRWPLGELFDDWYLAIERALAAE